MMPHSARAQAGLYSIDYWVPARYRSVFRAEAKNACLCEEPQTGVAPSRDSLRSQSVLLNLSEKTSSTLSGVEEVLQLGKKQGKYSFRKVNIVLTVSGRMRTKIKNLFKITTIPKRFFWQMTLTLIEFQEGVQGFWKMHPLHRKCDTILIHNLFFLF